MRQRRSTARTVLLAWAVAASGAASGVVVAQPPDVVPAGEILEEDIGEDVETLLAEADGLFFSADQPETIPLYERIILLLERRREEGTLDEAGADRLKLSRFRRAEAQHNLLEVDGARADLLALVRLDPAWNIPDVNTVSRQLSELLEEVREAETGVLDPLIEPPDAELILDGEPLGPIAGTRRVLAGERLLRVRRAGYTEVELPLTVAPGERVAVELVLERTSAVVRLTTTPAGVEVVSEGRVLAVSEARAGGSEEGVSAELAVGGLAPGEQSLTLRKPGYRPVELRVAIDELADYALAPAVLERTRGTVVLSRLPAGARLRLDGEPLAAPAGGAEEWRLELQPGPHQLRVEAGPAGLFEQRFDLADRQQLELDVRLRPGLVLLGVLGGDRVAATDLDRQLAERLGELSEWAAVDGAERGLELLREAAIETGLLRALAAESGGAEPPDWAALQASLDQGLAGSAYLVAVLSDDLVASRAELWLWSAAPGPARPARRRILLADGAGLAELAEELDRPLRLEAPWVGARFVDPAAGGAPLVLSVEPEGPAAAAGLRAGDRVGAVDGRPVAGAAELNRRLAALAPGAAATLQVGGEGEERSVSLTPGVSPVVVSLNDPSALDPALAARLVSLEASAGEEATVWLVRLNRAVVLMRSGEWSRAAETLRGIQAPASAGVGQGTVDYLLGVALLEVDRATYRDTARTMIGRAADGRARLEHNDGPLIEPRARARLETLLHD